MLVIQVSRTHKDYLQFLNKDLHTFPFGNATPIPLLTANCLTPDIFRVAARYSAMETPDEIVSERTRAPFFTVLSRFLDHKNLF